MVGGKFESIGATGLSVGGQAVDTPSSTSELPMIVGSGVGGSVAFVVIIVLMYYLRGYIVKNKQKKTQGEIVKFLNISEDEIVFDKDFKPVSGNFGDVRKGAWNGVSVAVKTMRNRLSNTWTAKISIEKQN